MDVKEMLMIVNLDNFVNLDKLLLSPKKKQLDMIYTVLSSPV